MSLIFDALQRSAGERSGGDLSRLSTATDLLERVERQTASEREIEPHPGVLDATESAEHDTPAPLSGVPQIGSLESSEADEPASNGAQVDLFAQFKSVHVSVPQKNPLVCLTASDSLAAENFRFLGVRLRHLRRERSLKKVLITSTIPREGKSTVAANLACALARQKQQRTLLVDGDLRRPAMAQMFGLDKMLGFSECLRGEIALSAAICHLEGTGLCLLPTGSALDHPLELLQSRKLSLLMDQVTRLFDWIIIDSPPVLPLADTSVWSRLADGILLVTRQGTTEKRQLQRGLEVIEPKKLIGALLNSSHSSTHTEYYGRYSQPTSD